MGLVEIGACSFAWAAALVVETGACCVPDEEKEKGGEGGREGGGVGLSPDMCPSRSAPATRRLTCGTALRSSMMVYPRCALERPGKCAVARSTHIDI
jgi:hypothetical protein